MRGEPLLLVDAHVHIHDCFELDAFLDAAWANFRSQAGDGVRPEGFAGVLLLAESHGSDRFQRLGRVPALPGAGARVPRWSLAKAEEPGSLRASSPDGRRLLLIAGHQIVTAERLEVLALCCEPRPREGLCAEATLDHTLALGGVPVLPWGAGKWLGARAAVLRRLLLSRRSRPLFLGDNGGRLALWPRPSAFRLAERLGWRVLPGSDPLPFPGHAARAGSVGFSLPAAISEERPAADLRRLLFDPGCEPRPFGALAGPLSFARDQLAMQLRIRLGDR